ncbi:MAG: S8 family peptidase [Oscillospiraceae bacterium]|nr:S8 family peptidase [Oscillospiraceae bacterium]
MNSLIQLKGHLSERRNPSSGGSASLPVGRSVNVDHIKGLKNNLETLYGFWEKNTIIDGALVSVFYNRVVPKSKRIKILLSKNNEESNNSIVGAKFTDTEPPKHIITHFIDIETIKINIIRLEKAIVILDKCYNGIIDNDGLKMLDNFKAEIEQVGISSKSLLNDIIVDTFCVEKFDVLNNSDLLQDQNIITIYDTAKYNNSNSIEKIMEKLGIDYSSFNKLDDTTIRINPKDLPKLKSNAPYLIAMVTNDLSEYTLDNIELDKTNKTFNIPMPNNEPIIGVIDTLFDKNVYFANWVKDFNLLDESIEIESKDYIHGTAVTSIIVDGPSFNPTLDDGCGRFRVRHFGIAKHGVNNSFTIMRHIKNIVESNTDIKVWNLSLGSVLEINPNFISHEAALLDELQFKNNIIFIVAGTNKEKEDVIKIGAPADSINSLVVNSVKFNGEIASYSRKGKVLSFFNKPDICYYGGDKNEEIRTCIGTGEHLGSGTSLAAPWITRKVAYLIEKLGLTREIAKALIIDSATKWEQIDDLKSEYVGFGKVPIKIDEVINSATDEIKFYIEDVSNMYDTYTHNIPVPIYQDKYPFIAKATICYFPKCSRNQGVDYTNTELDIYFGRIDDKGKIKSINENNQSEGLEGHTTEKSAREFYRKWDNVKHITQTFKDNLQSKKKYDNRLWGLSIKSKDRLGKRDGEGIKFGVVITLKEINGVNRIDEFINQCSLRAWLANKIDVDNKIEIYNKAEEEVEFN